MAGRGEGSKRDNHDVVPKLFCTEKSESGTSVEGGGEGKGENFNTSEIRSIKWREDAARMQKLRRMRSFLQVKFNNIILRPKIKIGGGFGYWGGARAVLHQEGTHFALKN